MKKIKICLQILRKIYNEEVINIYYYIFFLLIFFSIKIVKNDSMSPVLKNKDIVFVLPFFFIKKNAIYGFKYNNKIYVKRVVAFPKDIIEINKNILFINYNKFCNVQGNMSSIILKDEEYFFLGDNLLDSLDSRNFGPIFRKNIKFKIIFILYPFNRIGFVK